MTDPRTRVEAWMNEPCPHKARYKTNCLDCLLAYGAEIRREEREKWDSLLTRMLDKTEALLFTVSPQGKDEWPWDMVDRTALTDLRLTAHHITDLAAILRARREGRGVNARVTVTYVVLDICEPSDLVDTGMTLDEMVRSLIESEGITGIADVESIVSVEELPTPPPTREGVNERATRL